MREGGHEETVQRLMVKRARRVGIKDILCTSLIVKMASRD